MNHELHVTKKDWKNHLKMNFESKRRTSTRARDDESSQNPLQRDQNSSQMSKREFAVTPVDVFDTSIINPVASISFHIHNKDRFRKPVVDYLASTSAPRKFKRYVDHSGRFI